MQILNLLTNCWLHKINSKENLVLKPNKEMESCEMLHRIKVMDDVNEYITLITKSVFPWLRNFSLEFKKHPNLKL